MRSNGISPTPTQNIYFEQGIQQMEKGNYDISTLVKDPNLSAHQLCEMQLSGIHRGKSLLWLVAWAAVKGHPEPFMMAWRRFHCVIEIKDLRVFPFEGSEKYKNVFRLLLEAVANGFPQGFEAVWEKFAQSSSSQGHSTNAEQQDNNEPLMAEDFYIILEKNNSFLELFSFISLLGYREVSDKLWKKFSNELLIDMQQYLNEALSSVHSSAQGIIQPIEFPGMEAEFASRVPALQFSQPQKQQPARKQRASPSQRPDVHPAYQNTNKPH